MKRTPLLALALLALVASQGCDIEKMLGLKGKGHASSPSGRGKKKKDRQAPSGAGQAGGSDRSHIEMGTPKDGDLSDDFIMIKDQYALSYNHKRNVANWVSWNLNASHFGSAPRTAGKFISDESLPAAFYRVTHEDYSGSGFDRGHMVRSEERTRSPADNRATFLLTNILPQRHELNAGPWLRLEEYCQKLAKREGKELYLLAGGVFTPGKAPDTIGRGVAVPDAFFKIIVVLDAGEGASDVEETTRVIAVVMPNTTSVDHGFGGYRTSVREIEKKTGYDFLSAVPKHIQNAVEAKVDSGPTD